MTHLRITVESEAFGPPVIATATLQGPADGAGWEFVATLDGEEVKRWVSHTHSFLSAATTAVALSRAVSLGQEFAHG